MNESISILYKLQEARFLLGNVTKHIIHLRVHDSHKSSEISKRNGTKIIHHYVVIENVNFSLAY